MTKRWIFRQNDPGAERELVKSGVPLLAARVLSARKVRSPEAVRAVLSRELESIPDPMLMKGMKKAAARLRAAVERGEKCAVYGDYDVDGITAACLVCERLRAAGLDVSVCIPTRFDDGYGVARQHIDELARGGVTLVITVDLGITAHDEVEYAKSLGVDFIVTDHHECPGRLPKADAVVDPMRQGCGYPFKPLAGVGVAFMLMLAFEGRDRLAELMDAVGDLAAIGTIADVVPMVGVNATLTYHGLQRISESRRPGLRALTEETFGEQRRLDESAIGFSIAPRLNAAGRMGSAEDAVELLMTDDVRRAEELAAKLCELNRERQKLENDMLEEIYAKAEAMLNEESAGDRPGRALVLASDGWHQGIVGIVASRLAEAFARPVFLICLEDGIGRGSGRSFYGINILEIMKRAPHLFENWGGHEFAVGFTIREENIPLFAEIVGETAPALVSAHIDVDAEILPHELEPELVRGLAELGPFGAANPMPIFILKDAEICEVMPMREGRGARMRINAGGRSFHALCFSRDALRGDVGDGDSGDALVCVDPVSITEGGEVRLILESLRMPPDEYGRYVREFELYRLLRAGAELAPSEAARLMPEVRGVVAVLRYLRTSAGEDGATRARISSLCRRIRCAEHVDIGYGQLLVCLKALAEKERLEYKRDGEMATVRMGERKPTDLNTAPVILRLKKLMNSGEEGEADE